VQQPKSSLSPGLQSLCDYREIAQIFHNLAVENFSLREVDVLIAQAENLAGVSAFDFSLFKSMTFPKILKGFNPFPH